MKNDDLFVGPMEIQTDLFNNINNLGNNSTKFRFIHQNRIITNGPSPHNRFMYIYVAYLLGSPSTHRCDCIYYLCILIYAYDDKSRQCNINLSCVWRRDGECNSRLARQVDKKKKINENMVYYNIMHVCTRVCWSMRRNIQIQNCILCLDIRCVAHSK